MNIIEIFKRYDCQFFGWVIRCASRLPSTMTSDPPSCIDAA